MERFHYFLWQNSIPLNVYITFSSSVYLLMDTNWFHTSAIINNTAMISGWMYLFNKHWFFFRHITRSIISCCHMVVLVLVFSETSIMFSIVAIPVFKGSLFYTSLSIFVICFPFNNSHFGKFEIIFHCGLTCQNKFETQ